MTEELFDQHALAQRRRRAQALGPRLFLAERAVEDISERLSFVKRRFERPAMVGAPMPVLAEPLQTRVGPLAILPDFDALATIDPGTIDLLVMLGQLDTANDPAGLLRVLAQLLAPGALLIGVVPGNDSLPMLRTAMLAADQAAGGGVAPRIHPRLLASAVAGLLSEAGFSDPVVDLDRVRLRYRSFNDLVADLRAMGATNILSQRSRRPFGRGAIEAAREAFAAGGDERGTVETIELVHFTAWTAEQRR